MVGTADFVVVAVVPLLVSILAFTLAYRLKATRQSACLLAIGSGFVLAALAMAVRDRMAFQLGEANAAARWQQAISAALVGLLRPREARGWLVLASLMAMLVAGFESAASKWRDAIWLALFIALPVRLLWGSAYFISSWSVGGAVLRVLAISAAMFTIYFAARQWRDDEFDQRRDARSSVLYLLVCLVVAGATSLVLLLTGSKTYGETAGAFGAAIMGALLAASVVPSVNYQNSIGFVTLVVGGLLLLGCSFSQTAVWQAITLGVAAGIPLLALPQTSGSLRQRWAILALMIVIVSGVCLQAGFQFLEDTRSEPNPYGQYK